MLLALLLLLCSVAAVESAQLKKFMGFYGGNATEMQGWSNAFFSPNPKHLVEARLLGYTHQLLGVYWTFVEEHKRGGKPALRLVPHWRQLLETLVPLYTDLLNNGTIVGFFLGDELMWNGFPYEELSVWSAALRLRFPSSFMWENEAYPVYNCAPGTVPSSCAMYGPCCDYYQRIINITNGVPPGLNVTSIDLYRWNPSQGSIVRQVKGYYRNQLLPRLHEGQKLFVVPGSDASTHNPECNFTCYDTMCASDAAAFYEWILNDSMITGAMPWAWKSCGAKCIGALCEIGTRHMIKAKAAWERAGAKIIQLPY